RVALDHDSCMEVSVLRGPTKRVEEFAENVIAERGATRSFGSHSRRHRNWSACPWYGRRTGASRWVRIWLSPRRLEQAIILTLRHPRQPPVLPARAPPRPPLAARPATLFSGRIAFPGAASA